MNSYRLWKCATLNIPFHYFLILKFLIWKVFISPMFGKFVPTSYLMHLHKKSPTENVFWKWTRQVCFITFIGWLWEEETWSLFIYCDQILSCLLTSSNSILFHSLPRSAFTVHGAVFYTTNEVKNTLTKREKTRNIGISPRTVAVNLYSVVCFIATPQKLLNVFERCYLNTATT